MEMKSKYRILIALAILPFVVTGVFLIFLPDQVPMHYNARGELDRMGSKYENLLLPVLYLIPAALLFFLAKKQRKKQESFSIRLWCLRQSQDFCWYGWHSARLRPTGSIRQIYSAVRNNII